MTIGNTCFNTQPPEGGWPSSLKSVTIDLVSTHSRLKAAGSGEADIYQAAAVSTHSRLKAAGLKADSGYSSYVVSTHSRLKAAGA